MKKSSTKETSSFSFDEAIHFGWNGLKANFKLFLLIGGIFLLVSIAEKIVENILHSNDLLTPVITLAIKFILQSFLMLGSVHILLKIAKKKKAQIHDMFSLGYLLPNYIGATVIKYVLVITGFIFFIIPGIILAIKLQYTGFIVVDEKAGPFEALRRSWEITRGNGWRLLGFGVVLLLINVLGLLCFFVGIFITVPITSLAAAYVYNKLSSR